VIGEKKRKITNNYPLPLILDIVENISTKKVFRLVMGIWINQGNK